MSLRLSHKDFHQLRETSARMLSLLEHGSVDSWATQTVASLKHLMGADRSFLAFPGSVNGQVNMARSDEELRAAEEAYMSRYHRLDIYLGRRRRALRTSTFVHEMLIRPEEMRTSEYWNDWNVRYSVCNPAGIALDVPGVLVPASAVVYRERVAQGSFGTRGRALLKLLEPSWRAAVGILSKLTAHHAAFLAHLDTMAQPALLVDERGQTIHANRSLAEDRELDGLLPRLRPRIATIVCEVMSRDISPRPSQTAFGPIGFSIQTPLGRNLSMSAVPIGRVGGRRAALVLMEIAPRERLLSFSAMRHTYGLTDRECEVATLLARRRSNEEIASLLCISPHTARRHTERVLSKLGVSGRRRVKGRLRYG